MRNILFLLLVLIVGVSGCKKSPEESDFPLQYFVLIGDIKIDNGIPSVSGMPFDSPVTIFINGNPVIATHNPDMIWVTRYMTSVHNTVSVQTDSKKDFELGVYYQDYKTFSDEVFKTTLNHINHQAEFKIDNVPSDYRLFPSDAKLPQDNAHDRQLLREIINNLYENIKSRNAKQVVDTLHKGRIQSRTNHGIQTKTHEIELLNEYIKDYSRTDYTIKSFDLEEIEFIWGKSIVLAYNKNNLNDPYKNIIQYEFPEGAKPMPLITHIWFIYVNGQWIIW